MEMTAAWMGETVQFLEERGFAVAQRTESREVDGELAFVMTEYRLERGAQEQLVLQTLAYPDGSERYLLELVAWHGMSGYPFRLDSWRHRGDRVEFKYYVDVSTGVGLAFFLDAGPPR